MKYSAILSRALHIAWRQRTLWLFGFASALIAGGGNSISQVMRLLEYR